MVVNFKAKMIKRRMTKTRNKLSTVNKWMRRKPVNKGAGRKSAPVLPLKSKRTTIKPSSRSRRSKTQIQTLS
jgi:hypothetical protein